jgi:monoterpene epsilon-lactone hydrolase
MPKRFLTNLLFRLWLKPLWRDIPSAEKVRRTFGIADRIAAIGKENVPVTKRDMGGVNIEWIGHIDDAKNGVIVYLHGGGFAVRAPLADRRFCKTLSCRTGMPVILVAYRLAPEHRFPAGLNDCCQVYESLLEQGIPASRIVLIGHSAGANIALVLLMRARDKKLAQPAGAVLLSAPTDMTAGSASAIKNAEKDPMQGPNIWPWAKNIYLGATPPDNIEVSPLFGEWSGLPPMHFHVSDTEIILDDSKRAFERAKMAGCDVGLSVWHDVPHNFPFIDYLAEAKDCQIEISAFINEVIGKATTGHQALPNPANSLLETDAFQRWSA